MWKQIHQSYIFIILCIYFCILHHSCLFYVQSIFAHCTVDAIYLVKSRPSFWGSIFHIGTFIHISSSRFHPVFPDGQAISELYYNCEYICHHTCSFAYSYISCSLLVTSVALIEYFISSPFIFCFTVTIMRHSIDPLILLLGYHPLWEKEPRLTYMCVIFICFAFIYSLININFLVYVKQFPFRER